MESRYKQTLVNGDVTAVLFYPGNPEGHCDYCTTQTLSTCLNLEGHSNHSHTIIYVAHRFNGIHIFNRAK
jgi:hypothetical protein